jgi:hypothetical protein
MSKELNILRKISARVFRAPTSVQAWAALREMWSFVASYIADTSPTGIPSPFVLGVDKAISNVLDEISFADACGKELVDRSSIRELRAAVRSVNQKELHNSDMLEEQWVALDLACKTSEVLVYWYLLKPEGRE